MATKKQPKPKPKPQPRRSADSYGSPKKKNSNPISNAYKTVNKGLRASDKFTQKITGADQFKKVVQKGLTPKQRAQAAAQGTLAGGLFIGGNAAIKAVLRTGSALNRGFSK